MRLTIVIYKIMMSVFFINYNFVMVFQPPFSMNRFVGGIMVGYFWGSLIHMAIPEQEFGGVDWRFLYWLTPIGIGLGVWIVGNIGHEQGNLIFFFYEKFYRSVSRLFKRK